MSMKDKIIISCIMFSLWAIGTTIGCIIGIVLFKD